MPKVKTHKGAKARLKLTKTGKVKRFKASARHLMASKPAKRRRHLHRPTLVSKADEKRFKTMLTS